MLNVIAHAATSPGEPPTLTVAERRDSGRRDVAQSVLRLLTGLGDMP